MRQHLLRLSSLLLLAPLGLAQDALQHHHIKVSLDPETRSIVATDSIDLPAGWNTESATFELGVNLKVTHSVPAIASSKPGEDGTTVYTLDTSSTMDRVLPASVLKIGILDL